MKMVWVIFSIDEKNMFPNFVPIGASNSFKRQFCVKYRELLLLRKKAGAIWGDLEEE
jgi:hypothetical protein